ncbi:Chlorhexidine efflux transporter [Basfia succiniciproducens]|nr:Chlorhexidine efflux transporter [Basfia succiniciproducens]
MTVKERLFHTVAFETGLLIFTIPVIAYFLAVDWFTAFLMDVGISITIMLYGYFLTGVTIICGRR